MGSLAGIGLAGVGLFDSCAPAREGVRQSGRNRAQQFNMTGYAAPALGTVRVGFIGLGMRGPSHLSDMLKIENVKVTAVCDIRPDKAGRAQKTCQDHGHSPAVYSGGADEWKKVCDAADVDLIYIATPWDLHVPMAVYAMEQGKHVAIEVPAAVTLEECWQLVETSERTRKHCMMLENCCYDFFELLTLNMARQGFFGEIVHTEGAYIHQLVGLNFSKGGYYDMWRLKENFRNGNLYPTHGLGPICQIMNINRGDQMDYLVSVSTDDFTMGPKAKELAATDDFFKEYAGKSYRGNMNTTTVRTHKGKTIMIQHDVSSTRPYSRIHLVSGTDSCALKYPEPGKIATSHSGWVKDAEFKALEEKYQPPIVKKLGELARRVGGHGGMDFLMNWRLIDCLRNGLPLEQDVYDAALWSAIAPLSEQSVANRARSIDVPDFTGGSWKTNAPVDVTMSTGGNTNVKG